MTPQERAAKFIETPDGKMLVDLATGPGGRELVIGALRCAYIIGMADQAAHHNGDLDRLIERLDTGLHPRAVKPGGNAP
jgi:hypothetical protein